MLGRGGADDPRDVSIAALMQRYGIDAAQAQRVEATALRLFDQVAKAWSLDDDDRMMLARAARVHELGLAIAHSQYHVHGAYVLANSDIAGYSQQEQRFLAVLVRTHRRGIPKSAFDTIPDRLLGSVRRLSALLRLAVLLHRSHEAEDIPALQATVDGNALDLRLDKRWLDARPLLRADLAGEPEDFQGLGIQLRFDAA
jgi:exopolyphosphatase / guanosine-5'-triphosphate,3'-diphosphate pyrophosphatase